MTAFVAKSGWLADEGRRLEAATYAEGGLDARDRIVGGRWPVARLDQVARVFNEARFARIYVDDPARSVGYLTGADMLLLDPKGLLRLSIARTPQLERLTIKPRWTLISCSGTIGRTVFVRDEIADLAVSHDVIRVVPDDSQILSGYLFAFLSSQAAQAMIRQRAYGSVIRHIEPSHIVDLPVPLLDQALQQRIHDLVVRAAEARTTGADLLDTASDHFDQLGGVGKYRHYHERSLSTRPSREVGSRLDAFSQVGWAAEPAETGPRLGDLAEVWSVSSMARVWARNGVPFGSGASMFFIRPMPEKRLARWSAERVSAFVDRGDLLVQAYGQIQGLIGHAVMVGNHSCDWAIGHLMVRVRPRTPSLGGRLLAFFRSDAGRRQVVRRASGNQIPHFTAGALRSVRIPELPQGPLDGANRGVAAREQADSDEERAVREIETWLA